MKRRALGVVVHSLVLAIANIGSVVIGFAVYYIVAPANQLAVQIPIGVAGTVGLFALWMAGTQRGPVTILRIERALAGLWIYLAAFVWAGVLFVPLHLATQGYLTSFGNLAALALFQGVVNVMAIAVGLSAARVIPGDA